MASKRGMPSPSGKTPVRPSKRQNAIRERDTTIARRPLFNPPNSWIDKEDEALTSFILISNVADDKWPSVKSAKFWEGASTFIQNMCGTVRTSGSCRTRVTRHLIKCFKTPKAAEEYYSSLHSQCSPSQMDDDHHTSSSPTSSTSAVSINIETVDRLAQLLNDLCLMDPEQHLLSLSESFATYCTRVDISLPSDFLVLAVKGMLNLKSSNRSNIVYALAKGLGSQRSSGNDSLLPVKSVLTGLIEYSVNFFTSDNLSKVSCPEDYRLWLQTMYCHFGNKWLNLHGGPMWKFVATEQGGPSSSDSHLLTSEARVNIPALSARSIQRDIQKSSFTSDARIQESILNDAYKALPDTEWWIKSDGCDVIAGLTESMRLEWSGDVDLGDGNLQKQYSNYIERVSLVKHINRHISEVEQRMLTAGDLLCIKESIVNDLTYIDKALKEANKELLDKVSSGRNVGDKELFSLSWTVDGLGRLISLGRQIYAEVVYLLEFLQNDTANFIKDNTASKLVKLQESLLQFIREVTRHQRKKATHILVTMISPSERLCKPYALPVSCVPYRSLTAKEARTFISKIIFEMNKRNMKVAGFVSNGEYNSFRSMGYTRPLSVLKVRSIARNKYSKMSIAKMEAMLEPIVELNGNVSAKLASDCISKDVLKMIYSWKLAGADTNDIIDRLRVQCVPSGYIPKPWNSNRPVETYSDKLRSILAQSEYSHQICQYTMKGVPFSTYMYVPEVHPITDSEYHEREDDAHVLKRIATATRSGGPAQLQLERFVKALDDPTSGLTYPALTGQRKQSVQDAERLFSEGVAKYMERNDYTFEAKFVRTVLNWRRASDERGLTELERCRYNYNMLNFLLDDLMPWHRDNYDFSTLEVNRDTTAIQGMTQQTLIALTTTIESREWMRRKRSDGVPAEHPRASTTDDVECFFSTLRDTIGNHFTCKSVMTEWKKVCIEYSKRIDKDLPFYYYTATHDRFFEGERPTFDKYEKSKQNPRQQRLRTIEQPGLFAAGRTTMIKTGEKSIRRQFHQVPVELPPPPETAIADLIAIEHSY